VQVIVVDSRGSKTVSNGLVAGAELTSARKYVVRQPQRYRPHMPSLRECNQVLMKGVTIGSAVFDEQLGPSSQGS
jgi:hypothetical protein